MNLKVIILTINSESVHHKRLHIVRIHLCNVLKTMELNRLVVFRGQGWRRGEL